MLRLRSTRSIFYSISIVLLCLSVVSCSGALRKEAARLVAELQALSQDKNTLEREASAAKRKKEAELATAREEVGRLMEEVNQLKEGAADLERKVRLASCDDGG